MNLKYLLPVLTLLATNGYAASGTLTGVVPCPWPGLYGISYSRTFVLNGVTPPADAAITHTSGSWAVMGYNSNLVVAFGNDGIGWNDVSNFQSWQTSMWDGLSPGNQFKVEMFVLGQGIETEIIGGGECSINVSWTAPDPVANKTLTIRALRIVSGLDGTGHGFSDVDGDGAVGVAEAIENLRNN